MAHSVLDIIKESSSSWEVVKVDPKDLRLRCRLVSATQTPWMPFQEEVREFLPENMEFMIAGGTTRLALVT